jgi:glycosyltransferase involved in cell wall biosynthesis
MKVLITVVGKRTEHWTDLFAVLAQQPGLHLTVAVADVSPLTIQSLQRCASQSSQFSFHHLPHVLSEARSGHMASIMIAPQVLRRWRIESPDVLHIIGEPAYLSTWQVLGLRNRSWPAVPVTHYAAQNVLTRFPIPFPALERRAYRTVDHIFPITPAALKVLRSKGYRGAASIIPLGVDTTLFKPGSRQRTETFTVGFVGRLEAHKGIAGLLQAVDTIGCNLLVVGQGTLSGLVRDAAAANQRIRLIDWADHDELPGLLTEMDVLALPSAEVVQRNVVPWVGIPLREQFGRVLVEAMACGVPVVGSDIGEIPHVIGDAGLVFAAGNVNALIERLVQLRDDPAFAQQLGKNGVERASVEFGWDNVASSMRKVWDGLCSVASVRRRT